jgi:hypothetical protein
MSSDQTHDNPIKINPPRTQADPWMRTRAIGLAPGICECWGSGLPMAAGARSSALERLFGPGKGRVEIPEVHKRGKANSGERHNRPALTNLKRAE